jgi:hypothetical protein
LKKFSKILKNLLQIFLHPDLNIMVLEGSGVAVFLDNKKLYPTLLRFCFTQLNAGQLVEQFMELNNWVNVVVIYNADEAIFRVLVSIADGIKLGGRRKVDILPYYYYSRGTADIERVIAEAHNQARGKNSSISGDL